MAYDSQPTGTLAKLVANIQEWSNEPRIKAKYTASKLYPLIKANFKEVFSEVMRLADNMLIMDYSFTVTDGTQVTQLPVNIAAIHRIVERNSTYGTPDVIFSRGSDRRIGGPGFRIDGNVIRWLPYWTGPTKTLVLEYIPNGEVNLAYGTTDASTCSDTIITLDTTPNEGYFDKRSGIYVGSYLTLLGAGSALDEVPAGFSFFPEQTRLITGYEDDPDANGPQITVAAPFEFDPSSGLHNGASGFTDLRYEIVPEGLEQLADVVAWRTVMTLHRVEGNPQRLQLAQQEYMQKFRDLKMTVAQMDPERGSRFEHDVGPYIRDFWGLL